MTLDFDAIIQHYGLTPQQRRAPGRDTARQWITGLMGNGHRWEYVTMAGGALLVRTVKPTSAVHVDFAYAPTGELLYDDRAPVALMGDEYFALGLFFPQAETRGLCIQPPGEHQEVAFDVPYLSRTGDGPVEIEFLEPASYVCLNILATTPYVLQVYREDEENVVSYRDVRIAVEFHADRADIHRVAFGHGLALIAIASIDFEH